MKIFLDSNVLVDWIPARETGSFEEATKIFGCVRIKKDGRIYFSTNRLFIGFCFKEIWDEEKGNKYLGSKVAGNSFGDPDGKQGVCKWDLLLYG